MLYPKYKASPVFTKSSGEPVDCGEVSQVALGGALPLLIPGGEPRRELEGCGGQEGCAGYRRHPRLFFGRMTPVASTALRGPNGGG